MGSLLFYYVEEIVKQQETLRYYDSFKYYHENNQDPTKLIELIREYASEELTRYIAVLETAQQFY